MCPQPGQVTLDAQALQARFGFATARFQHTRPIDPGLLRDDGTLVRYGTPRDQANAVAFLCSPAAKYIHGQFLRVDGGLTLF